MRACRPPSLDPRPTFSESRQHGPAMPAWQAPDVPATGWRSKRGSNSGCATACQALALEAIKRTRIVLSSAHRKKVAEKPSQARGKLKIGDDWNAITIIALSQSSPLKAIAELVENSIDARATNVTIIRGRSEGRHYLEVRDNGQGIPRDAQGRPDFRYVATHICDSVKRRLKVDGVAGLQGEFGIGLLSFWTLGEELTLTSTGADERAWQMVMRKGDPSYAVKAKRLLFMEPGTQLRIARLLDGIRSLSGEKIQWYLAAELRDRIRHTGVRITVIDN